MIDSHLLKITYAKSSVGYSQRQKDTIRSLGLRRLGESVMLPDSPPVRGMIDKVIHLVAVEPVGEVQVEAAKGAAPAKKGAAPAKKSAAPAKKSAGKAAARKGGAGKKAAASDEDSK